MTLQILGAEPKQVAATIVVDVLFFVQPLQDWMLALGVGFLVGIDLVILVVYTVVGSFQGNLRATLISNTENPEETSGVRPQ